MNGSTSKFTDVLCQSQVNKSLSYTRTRLPPSSSPLRFPEHGWPWKVPSVYQRHQSPQIVGGERKAADDTCRHCVRCSTTSAQDVPLQLVRRTVTSSSSAGRRHGIASQTPAKRTVAVEISAVVNSPALLPDRAPLHAVLEISLEFRFLGTPY